MFCNNLNFYHTITVYKYCPCFLTRPQIATVSTAAHVIHSPSAGMYGAKALRTCLHQRSDQNNVISKAMMTLTVACLIYDQSNPAQIPLFGHSA